LIPDPKDPGGCDDPDRDNCSADDLRKQLVALTQCISSQQSAKARIEADIKARGERADALKELIKNFDDILKKYKEQRHKLICREDCLKGFYRDINTYFSKFPSKYLDDLEKSINKELCEMEMERCCQVNLERKLTTVTKVIWQQQEAEKELNKANKAVEIIKDLPKWLDERFKELETLKDEIAQALNDTDQQKHKWAFFLFYWKFIPKLCRCFPFPFCCGKEDEDQSQETPPSEHLGCEPGDWHPSAITVERLQALICCAFDYARKQKQNLQDATDRVADATRNLEFVKNKVVEDAKTLDDRIKSGLAKIEKPVVPTSR
jgi:deferrochelatase/peroxidase EfeB